MPDVSSPTEPTSAGAFAFAAEQLDQVRQAGLYRDRDVFRLLPGGFIEQDGTRLIDFASNNYLGLAASSCTGTAGAGSSALVSGRSAAQDELERRLARFENTDDVLLFPTGYAANLGTTAAIATAGDTIFLDKLSHSCLVEGAKLSTASLRVYRSDRLATLDRELAKAVTGRRIVVTDGVFSMDGTLAPLGALTDLCETYGAILVVDEAHGSGVFGATGRGACEHLGIPLDRVVRTGTLSKAFGGLGGFVSGQGVFIDWLRHHARTQMFATALPPVLCEHAMRSLDIIENEPQRRATLFRLSDHLRSRLRSSGWTVPDSIGPIVPVLIGSPHATVGLAERLRHGGFLVGCIRPPTVPRGTSRLRISVSAVHTMEMVDSLAHSMKQP